MIIADEIRNKYTTYDPELSLFMDSFDEPENSLILEVGAHDNPVAEMLVDCGHSVVGVDLRPYDQPTCRHWHYTNDFCSMPKSFWGRYHGKFDSVIAISSLEHFGLGTYGETDYMPYYDVIAARYIWDLLKDGGSFYVTVPYGAKYWENRPHWRVYDSGTLFDRIVQDFTVEMLRIAVVQEFQLNDQTIKVGSQIDPLWIMSIRKGEPVISCMLKLRKNPVVRKAHDNVAT